MPPRRFIHSPEAEVRIRTFKKMRLAAWVIMFGVALLLVGAFYGVYRLHQRQMRQEQAAAKVAKEGKAKAEAVEAERKHYYVQHDHYPEESEVYHSHDATMAREAKAQQKQAAKTAEEEQQQLLQQEQAYQQYLDSKQLAESATPGQIEQYKRELEARMSTTRNRDEHNALNLEYGRIGGYRSACEFVWRYEWWYNQFGSYPTVSELQSDTVSRALSDVEAGRQR